MTIRQKSYKFRLCPNQEQKQLFAKTFGSSRAIWNMMLADKMAYYKETGGMLNNTPAQYKKDFPWLREVDSLALANVQLNLQKAYKGFSNLVLVFLNLRRNAISNRIRLIIRKERLLFRMGNLGFQKLGGLNSNFTVKSRVRLKAQRFQ